MRSPPSKPTKLTRRLESNQERALQPEAVRIGQISWAWNNLHSCFFFLFYALSKAEDESALRIAHAIWHSFQSDRAQRDMVLAVAEQLFKPKSRMFGRIKWAKDCADKLSPHRTDAAHTPIIFVHNDNGSIFLAPDVMTSKRVTLERWVEGSFRRPWPALKGDLLILAKYVAALAANVIKPDGAPFPHRPRLLTIPATQRRARKGSRPRAKAKPSRRPPPSPE